MSIRFAKKEDEPRIVAFLKENWNPKNILITSPMIFEYQYMSRTECGFVLAEDDETGEIRGIKGFIPVNSEETPDITAALAIAHNDTRPMLNMEMQRFLEKNTHCRMSYSTGLNPNTAARVYPLFHYTVEKMIQYYRLTPGRTEFRVAAIGERPEDRPFTEGKCFTEFLTMEDLLQHFSPEDYKENLPYKDAGYIRYRYYEHPVYRYRAYGLLNEDGKTSAVVILRAIACNDSIVLRIVDYLGDRSEIAGFGYAIDRLLDEYDAEYIDFFCYGMPQEAMELAGFTRRSTEDINIIPNYFEPFVQKNVEINFFCNLKENFLVCKADGDQDRPNILPEK